jgi:putative ATP-binding cassette transporter
MSVFRSKAWRDLWSLIHAYWWSGEKSSARLLLFGIVALTLGMVYMNVQINEWQNNFYNALQDKNRAEFYRQLMRFVLLASVWVVMSVHAQYFTQMLQIRWRRWLTESYVERWLADRAYYHMQFAGTQADNPDQRIAEDVRLFVDGSVSLFIGLLNAIVTLVSFIEILWILSGPLVVDIGTRQLTIPGYIVWVAVLYALAGDWLAHRVGRALIALNFVQQTSEANFRYRLVRLRDNADGVALYQGEGDELRGVRAQFSTVFSNWWEIMRRQKRLAWFTASYGQAAVVVPFIVAAPRFFSGALPLGGLMQTAGAFGYVRDALTWFVNAYVGFAGWKAAADRLTTFSTAIDTAREQQRSPLRPQVIDGTGADLKLDQVELDRPTGAPLINVSKLEIEPGSRTLIQGPSGAGKSTLLRAIAGIWPFGRGTIRRPHEFDALFLPDRAYFPLGTLREAICYPKPCTLFTDAQLQDALDSVGLPHLLLRLDESGNWSQTLSGADQQRVGFARALLHRPQWLFLDEATSDLDDASQMKLYELLTRRLPTTAIVSITGHEQLACHHVKRWELRGTRNGAYELLELGAQVA